LIYRLSIAKHQSAFINTLSYIFYHFTNNFRMLIPAIAPIKVQAHEGNFGLSSGAKYSGWVPNNPVQTSGVAFDKQSVRISFQISAGVAGIGTSPLPMLPRLIAGRLLVLNELKGTMRPDLTSANIITLLYRQ
jgi:hypothetical protein